MEDKIIGLANKYVEIYTPCFHSESTERWISRFATGRWNTTLNDYEISEEERSDENLKKIFVDEFVKEMKVVVSNMNVVVDSKSGKVKQVKRKAGN